MGTGTQTSTSKIVTILVMIPLLAVAWFTAPFFAPVWRWMNVDNAAIAKESGIPIAQLTNEFEWTVRFHPRGAGDPIPWQIVTSKPEWGSIDSKNMDERDLLVRATIISERDGEPISKLWVGASPDEKYFLIKGWRYPPGSFGKNKYRPVIVFQGYSLEKVDIGKSQVLNAQVTSWENDDAWRDRDDGWYAPGK